MADKIRAFEPHIRVNKDAVKPYYSIVYYDLADRVWHIGYSSYYLSYVIKWLQEEFEEVDIEFAEVKHGEWKRVECGTICTQCRRVYDNDFEFSHEKVKQYFKYCPECGADMRERGNN